MVHGILITDTGGVQVIGQPDVAAFGRIIDAMKQAMPQMEQAYRDMMTEFAKNLPPDVLEAARAAQSHTSE